MALKYACSCIIISSLEGLDSIFTTQGNSSTILECRTLLCLSFILMWHSEILSWLYYKNLSKSCPCYILCTIFHMGFWYLTCRYIIIMRCVIYHCGLHVTLDNYLKVKFLVRFSINLSLSYLTILPRIIMFVYIYMYCHLKMPFTIATFIWPCKLFEYPL